MAVLPRKSSIRTTISAMGATRRLIVTPPTLITSMKTDSIKTTRMLAGRSTIAVASAITIATPSPAMMLTAVADPSTIPAMAARAAH